MRVLFSSHPGQQHLFPIVPLAWACRAAGHEVRITGAPALADAIVHTGLPAVVVGQDQPLPAGAADIKMVFQHRPFPENWPLHPQLLDDQQRATVELLGRNCARTAEYTVDELIAFAAHWRPDLIVHDTAGFAGAVTAAAIGVPNVRHLNGFGLQPMETRVGGIEPIPEYAALFENRKLPVRVRPAMTVIPFPPSLQFPVAGPCRAMRYVPYNGPGTVPSWLAAPAGRPRVLITWGLSVSRAINRLGPQAMAPFRLAVDALSSLDIEAVVAATQEQLSLFDGVADNVRPVTGLPLHLVLPSCAAIVHQAGDGSSLTAAAYGVPQLTITRTPDTTLAGERLAAIGAGLNLRYQDLESDPDAGTVIAEAVAKLLADPTYTEAAVRLQEELNHRPAPAELVSALHALALAGG
jgi:glycosyltransferase